MADARCAENDPSGGKSYPAWRKDNRDPARSGHGPDIQILFSHSPVTVQSITLAGIRRWETVITFKYQPVRSVIERSARLTRRVAHRQEELSYFMRGSRLQ